jgi:hypothetical protein
VAPKAVERFQTAWERLVTFYQFPKAHGPHLRTTNVVESPCAAVRLRTTAGTRDKRVDSATALIWKLPPSGGAQRPAAERPGVTAAGLHRHPVCRWCAETRHAEGGFRLIPLTHLLTRPHGEGTHPMTNSLSKTAVANMNTRKARRVRLVCRLFFFGQGDFEGEAKVLDLSTSGCLAEAEVAVTSRMGFQLSMFLPDHPWPLRVEKAVVRWTHGRSFGLEFVTLRPAQRERLRAIVMKTKA